MRSLGHLAVGLRGLEDEGTDEVDLALEIVVGEGGVPCHPPKIGPDAGRRLDAGRGIGRRHDTVGRGEVWVPGRERLTARGRS